MVPVFGRNDDDRRVRPIGCGDGRYAIADAGAVLADHHAMAAADAGVAVGHVGGALFMDDGDEADAGGREDVHGIHEGRTHDAEHFGHAIGDQRFDERFRGRHFLHAGDRCTRIGSHCGSPVLKTALRVVGRN